MEKVTVVKRTGTEKQITATEKTVYEKFNIT
jgi:hypothetical protein